MERARLVATDPAEGTREFALSNSDVAVGSDRANDIMLTGAGISRRHAVLRLRDGRYFLDDLDSTNGSFINGSRVRGPTALDDGDRVRFGGAAFVFRDPRGAPAGKRRRSASRTVASLLVMFAAGFAIAAGLLNRDWLSRTIGRLARGSSPAASATPRAAGGELAANPVASPAATGSPTTAPATATEPEWLARLNYFRSMAGLLSVREDSRLNDGDFSHARYLVDNYGDMIRGNRSMGAAAHEEDAGMADYSAEGDAAARTSNVAWGCGPFSASAAIDQWMSGPFHRLGLLRPDLTTAGFGDYESGGCWAAAIALPTYGNSSRPATPIAFPPESATIGLHWSAGEWPDPLASCAGYSPPVGLPITLELGSAVAPEVSAYSLSEDGEAVEVCEFDQTNYTNSDEEDQAWARRGLQYFGAIVLVPRAPLVAGRNYSASITIGGQAYAWSFKFGAGSPP